MNVILYIPFENILFSFRKVKVTSFLFLIVLNLGQIGSTYSFLFCIIRHSKYNNFDKLLFYYKIQIQRLHAIL
jgi:hypothetical protein